MTIYFTVTNDLTYDQRMARICGSLANAGYNVILVGRIIKSSQALLPTVYKQKRLRCWFSKGKLFYAEYSLRLFCYLLSKKMDCICAIDLDTILPCLFISKIKRIKRVYDAHELFCEMKEVVTRPMIHAVWKRIERYTLPQFKNAYTVNRQLADEFYKMYRIKFSVIRNAPVFKTAESPKTNLKYFLYQGAVNEGRCFEMLIPAMKEVDCRLIICGDGNFMQQAQQLVKEHGLEEKVIFKGNVAPHALKAITAQAFAGINLVEDNGLSFYLSLANKFFDYIHAGIPQLCAGYPAYKEINDEHTVAILITDMSSKNIAYQLNNLLCDEVLYKKLQDACIEAKRVYNWQNEEKILLDFYNHLFE